MSSFRICGPKMAVFGTCLSVWGIIQLSFMALAFYSNSVAFVEDLPESAFNKCTEGKKDYTGPCSFQDNVDMAAVKDLGGSKHGTKQVNLMATNPLDRAIDSDEEIY